MVQMQSKSESPDKKRKAIKFSFAYEGEKIRLMDRQLTDKATRPSAPILEQGPKKGKKPRGESGFWIELHGRGGKALYRLVLSNPIKFHAEVPDDEGGFTNLAIEKPQGMFFVVVPNLPEARELVIFSSPLGPEAIPAPAEPITRFPLNDHKEE
jgi:hypothetical protein